MNEAEHEKQMLLQKITHHREQMRLELEVLREANPVLPLIRTGRQVLSVFRPVGGGGPRSQDELELAKTLLPTLLRVLRVLLRRREEKRARKERS